MKKGLFFIMMLCFTLQGNAQDLGMCTYDAAGNRLSRFTYILDRGRHSQQMAERDGKVDMTNERLGNHTIHVSYHSSTCTLAIEVLGLENPDNCFVFVYSLTGQTVYGQNVTTSPTELDLSDISNGVYLIRLSLNGENRCWKIIKK